MKFLIPVALLALGVSAQSSAAGGSSSSKCDADYIVTNCLESENAKLEACDYTDYDCQCAAAQSILTCYNNCPNDPRGNDAKGQVQIYCDNASIHGSKAMASRTTAAVATATDETTVASNVATTTKSGASKETATGTATGSAAAATTTNAAAEMIRNTGGVLLAVAGVVAAVL